MAESILRLLGGIFSASPSDKVENPTADRAAKGGGSDEPWVVVLTTFDMVEAQIAVARLEDEAIPVRSRREAASSALPVTNGILGRIEVLVIQSKAEQAVEVLKATLGYEDNDEEAEEHDDLF